MLCNDVLKYYSFVEWFSVFLTFFFSFFFFFIINAYTTDPAVEASERTFSSLVWFSRIITTNYSNNEPHSPRVIKIK